ncbi:ATP-binding protein [Streptomyces sp. H10-C2]|uniref:ATP-binding protein n=1 Tax=unclassified Streptomyces TaxID=2593676 RepID=UPI0024BB8CC1|nr:MULTISPECIES: ATP-binding protein [unclassified Streptomyces]MDJ0342412.1 ATP-binding protein [Streptomyces sp. PH10-H1]MDJ0372267.1 ATP-binding protein [Streptomyces sp. H10-C2]
MGTSKCASVWPPNGRGVPHSYTMFSPPLDTSPKIARDFIASVLRSLDLGHILDAAQLCTSELVTNSLQHAPCIGSLLRLDIQATRIRINVYDASPAEPLLRRGTRESSEHGRGLLLVDALADRWGTAPGGPVGLGGVDGKGVWCEIRTR